MARLPAPIPRPPTPAPLIGVVPVPGAMVLPSLIQVQLTLLFGTLLIVTAAAAGVMAWMETLAVVDPDVGRALAGSNRLGDALGAAVLERSVGEVRLTCAYS